MSEPVAAHEVGTGAESVAHPGDAETGSPEESAAFRSSTPEEPLGRPGRPLNRRTPFFAGLTGAAGVAVTAGAAYLVVTVSDTLVLIGMAGFVALGLDPAASALTRRGWKRTPAVAAVVGAGVVALAGLVLAVVVPLIGQLGTLATRLPRLLEELGSRHSLVAGLNTRLQLSARAEELLSGEGTGPALVLGVGKVALVLILSVYFLADLPRIRDRLYRLVPASRRPRVILLGDHVFAKVGGYVLGNLVISLIAGSAAFVWLTVLGVPYALPLALLVAALDLIPLVGAPTAAAACCLIGLTVSLPVALATAGFFLAYQAIEEYLLVPRIIGRAVRVPAFLTLVAVLLGGVLLGVPGVLVAVPVAAAVRLLLSEVTVRRLDRC